jgi:hypothetical protein
MIIYGLIEFVNYWYNEDCYYNEMSRLLVHVDGLLGAEQHDRFQQP